MYLFLNLNFKLDKICQWHQSLWGQSSKVTGCYPTNQFIFKVYVGFSRFDCVEKSAISKRGTLSACVNLFYYYTCKYSTINDKY